VTKIGRVTPEPAQCHKCHAGVALGHIHLRFAWQAWRLWHWAGSDGALGPVLVSGDAAALCVAGVALGDIHLRFFWQAWHGRRGTYGTELVLVARLGRLVPRLPRDGV